MGASGSENSGFRCGHKPRVLLLCLASIACGGQAADSAKPNPSAGGAGHGVNPTDSGGQRVVVGGVASQTFDGSENVASGGSAIVPPPSGGAPSGGGEEFGSGGFAPHAARECAIPAASDWGGGFLLCRDGSYRRHLADACKNPLPRPEPGSTCHRGDQCCHDADCALAPFGYCSYGACIYGCASDADCSSDSLCFCQDPIGKCVSATCRADADCPSDFPCSAGNGVSGPFACQSPFDACLVDPDCGGGQCRPSSTLAVELRGDSNGGRVCVVLPG